MIKKSINQNDIIYFVLTDRFFNGNPQNDNPSDVNNPKKFHGGDLDGLILKIPYLKNLGITAVWITPVYLNITDFFDSAGYHGYWAIDFSKIDPHLYVSKPGYAEGSRKYLKDFVSTFHDNNIKVILDMVVNHTGYHTPEYEQKVSNEVRKLTFNTGSGTIEGSLAGLPDLDHDNSDVTDYFIQNILDWIEGTGIDGIRMDTVKHVENKFWYFFKSCIKTSYPEITLIGEVLEWEPSAISFYQREHDFDTLFDFPLCGAIMGSLIWDRPLTEIARPRLSDNEMDGILDKDNRYTNANRLVTLLDNHDLSKRITTEILDKVGHWDRQLAVKMLKYCLTFIFTTRGIPQIYYGTEIGMEGYGDPDNRKFMPWSIFAGDEPKAENWFELSIFTHTKALIKLRKNSKAIQSGYLFTLYVDNFIYSFMREYRGDIVIVVMNNGKGNMQFPLDIDINNNSNIPGRIKDMQTGLLANGTKMKDEISGCSDIMVSGGKISVKIPGKTAAVYRKRKA